ncbi:MAG: glycosyltransferase family 2 protein [Bacillota bacterium]
MKNKKVSIIIPAYNEEKIIGETLKHLKFNWIKEIIVINDGSSDHTYNIIKNYPVKIINFEKNRGKGKAVKEGLNQATGNLISFLDADLGESVIEVEKLVKPVIEGKADITVAVLPIKGGGLGLVRNLARSGLKYLTGATLQAPLSGQRVFHSKVLKDLLPLADGFGLEVGMDIDLIRNNYKIIEIECQFTHNVTGKDWKGFVHRANQFRDILKTFWKKRE